MARPWGVTAILSIALAGCATIWDQVQVTDPQTRPADQAFAERADCQQRAAAAGWAYAQGQPREVALALTTAGIGAAAISAGALAMTGNWRGAGYAGIAGAAVGTVGALYQMHLELERRDVVREGYALCLRARGYAVFIPDHPDGAPADMPGPAPRP